MTVIAAVHQNGETWIGSDSQREWSGTRIIGAEKLIPGPGFYLACSGNSKAQQIIRRNVALFAHGAVESDIPRMIRQWLDDDKWAHLSANDGKGPADYGFVSILATPAQVFLMTGDFLLQPFADGELLGIGSGGEYAMGAGEALRNHDPATRVRAAVDAAIKWDTGCGGPAHVLRVEDAALRAVAE